VAFFAFGGKIDVGTNGLPAKEAARMLRILRLTIGHGKIVQVDITANPARELEMRSSLTRFPSSLEFRLARNG
jgi:hypothetical protein